MSITIRQIATELKLAVSTVSKALRDSHEISAETKRRVLDYANKHNYIPNAYAGSLKHRRTRNIAVVLPEVADTFFSNAINGIESAAKNKGYHVMVYLTHEDSNQEESILKELQGGRVDGILVSVSSGIQENSPVHARLAGKMPLVFFDRVCEGVETAKVVTDDFEASYRATSHLISQGCRRPVFLAAAGGLSIVDKRYKGFLKAMQDHQLLIDDGNRIECSNEAGKCHHDLSPFFRAGKMDGVICSVEKLAVHVYTLCREHHLRIPQDMKVISFSNLQIASLLSPPLSTVEQPAFEMGKQATILLFKALANKIDLRKERLVIPSVIRERESSLAGEVSTSLPG